MTLEEATTIRDKFYEGRSTLEEEQAWLEFLHSENCPEALTIDRELLDTLCEPVETTLPDGFVQRLHYKLQNQPGWDETQTHPKNSKTNTNLRWFKRTIGIAAVSTGLIIGGWVYSHSCPTVYIDTCSTPEEALQKMEEAFSTMSEHLSVEYTDYLPNNPV